MKRTRKATIAEVVLNELINYGGIPTPRWQVIADMNAMGATEAMINAWFGGYELRRKLDARRMEMAA